MLAVGPRRWGRRTAPVVWRLGFAAHEAHRQRPSGSRQSSPVRQPRHPGQRNRFPAYSNSLTSNRTVGWSITSPPSGRPSRRKVGHVRRGMARVGACIGRRQPHPGDVGRVGRLGAPQALGLGPDVVGVPLVQGAAQQRLAGGAVMLRDWGGAFESIPVLGASCDRLLPIGAEPPWLRMDGRRCWSGYDG